MKSAKKTPSHGPIELVTIETTKTERDALLAIQKRFFPGSLSKPHGRPLYSDMARFVLQHVLAHPEAVHGMIRSFQNYRNLEGFDGRGNELALARLNAATVRH